MPRHASRDILVGIAGAISTLTAVSAYLSLSGYRLQPVPNYSPHPLSSVHYVLVLTILGAALFIAWHHTLRVTPPLAVAGLLASPLTVPTTTRLPSVFRLNIEFTAVTVLFLLLASAEYAIRNPDTVSSILTPRARRTALWTGTFHLLPAFTFHATIDPGSAYFFSLFNTLLAIWMAVGAFIVGAVPGVLAARYGLLTPIAIVLGASTTTAYLTWEYVQSIGNNAPAAAFTAFDLYLIGWFITLGLIVLVGVIERRFRTRGIRSSVTGTS